MNLEGSRNELFERLTELVGICDERARNRCTVQSIDSYDLTGEEISITVTALELDYERERRIERVKAAKALISRRAELYEIFNKAEQQQKRQAEYQHKLAILKTEYGVE